LFSLAIGRELFTEDREAADHYLARATTDSEVRALATLVAIVARGEQGHDEEVVSHLMALFKNEGKGSDGKSPRPDLGLAVAEGYLQRLIRLGRYDEARKLCATMCDEDAAPEPVKGHFETRMAPLVLLGKRAPAIEGVDVEGKKVSLAEMKGKVVLIDFWATWCPPCVAELPRLKKLAASYGDRDFAILGINVDARHEDVKEMSRALPVVRRFLAHHEVSWTNLLDGNGAGDFAKSYGVEQIPATFLVGRDGTVVAVELTDEALEHQVARALRHPGEASATQKHEK
jgi:thiol-disulfide isomerase/thioredoxin